MGLTRSREAHGEKITQWRWDAEENREIFSANDADQRECRVGLDRRADPRFRRGGAVSRSVVRPAHIVYTLWGGDARQQITLLDLCGEIFCLFSFRRECLKNATAPTAGGDCLGAELCKVCGICEYVGLTPSLLNLFGLDASTRAIRFACGVFINTIKQLRKTTACHLRCRLYFQISENFC